MSVALVLLLAALILLQALATGLTAPSILNAEARKHETHMPHLDNSAFTLLAVIDAVEKECPGLHLLDRWVASNMLEMMTHVSFRAEFQYVASKIFLSLGSLLMGP